MIKAVLNNEILKLITVIEENRCLVREAALPASVRNRLRKNSKKKSSYASNKIEGNPLTEDQADRAIESDPHRHFLKPEQEIRNYYLALEYLDKERQKGAPFSLELILKVQAMVEKGASREKIGLRQAMPPGVLFAVYDNVTGAPEYIPPEFCDVPALLEELVEYVQTTDDHPLIIAAIAHYQLVTIHPFEDGNGRTARLLSGYILDSYGYGFAGIGSLEEYFSYDPDEYYRSLQMGLPALYYSGRNDPPHPEIWISYFLRMVSLYSAKVKEISASPALNDTAASLSYLKDNEAALLKYLLENRIRHFTPIEISRQMGVTNRTIINRCAALTKQGFLVPVLVKKRIRYYEFSAMTAAAGEELICRLDEKDAGMDRGVRSVTTGPCDAEIMSTSLNSWKLMSTDTDSEKFMSAGPGGGEYMSAVSGEGALVIERDSELGQVVTDFLSMDRGMRNRLIGYMQALKEMEKKDGSSVKY